MGTFLAHMFVIKYWVGSTNDSIQSNNFTSLCAFFIVTNFCSIINRILTGSS